MRRLLSFLLVVALPPIVGARSCGAPVGAPCAEAADCRSAPVPECRDWPGGYCTGRCERSEECGTFGACVEADDEGGLCLLRCRDASFCRSGYDCRGTMDGYRVCLPE